MRAKLAIADSWYKEGGTAALTQAEQEYKDFITFFPNAPEAAEAQMRVGDIYFRQMDKPDRDYAKAVHAEHGVPHNAAAVPGFRPSFRTPSSACAKCRRCWRIVRVHDCGLLFDARQLAGDNCSLPDGRRHLSAVQPHGRRADRAWAMAMRPRRSTSGP